MAVIWTPILYPQMRGEPSFPMLSPGYHEVNIPRGGAAASKRAALRRSAAAAAACLLLAAVTVFVAGKAGGGGGARGASLAEMGEMGAAPAPPSPAGGKGPPVVNIVSSHFTSSNVNIAVDKSNIKAMQTAPPSPAPAPAVAAAPAAAKEADEEKEEVKEEVKEAVEEKEEEKAEEKADGAGGQGAGEGEAPGKEVIPAPHGEAALHGGSGPGFCSLWYWNPVGRRGFAHMPDVSMLFPQVARVFPSVDFKHDRAFEGVVGTAHFDRVAITFRGTLDIVEAGRYTICTKSDDGSHLMLDDKPFVKAPGLHPPKQECAEAKLDKGPHKIFIKFFENGGGAYMRATYKGPDTGGVEKVIKSTGFEGACDAPRAKCECGKGWCGDFFYDPNGQGQIREFVDTAELNGQAAKITKTVDFKDDKSFQEFLGGQSKIGGFDRVAAQFNGVVRIEEAGEYKLCTESDDGSRLFIDGQVLVENGGLHPRRKRCETSKLSAGAHPVLVDFFENGGGANIRVTYEGPDTGGKEELMQSIWHNENTCGPLPA